MTTVLQGTDAAAAADPVAHDDAVADPAADDGAAARTGRARAVAGWTVTALAALLVLGALAVAALVRWLARRKREGKPALIDPDLFRSVHFRTGITGQMLQQIGLGGAIIALPIYLQMVLEYDAMQAGLSLAPLSLTMFALALLAGKRAGTRRPSSLIRLGFLLFTLGMAILVPIIPRADSGWALAIPLVIAGAGLGLLVSQLNNYSLSPVADERASEAAGVNSAAGSFGLSFGLAFGGAIMLATLSIGFVSVVVLYNLYRGQR